MQHLAAISSKKEQVPESNRMSEVSSHKTLEVIDTGRDQLKHTEAQHLINIMREQHNISAKLEESKVKLAQQ